MANIHQHDARNLLLRSLDSDAFTFLEEHLDRVALKEGEVLVDIDGPIETVCFPEGTVVSFAEVLGAGTRLDVGVAGFEGMAGWPVLLGASKSPHHALVQVGGGTALRAPAEAVVEMCRRWPGAQALLLRYIGALMVQVARTAASNLRDPVERRLARWLLMCHDRLDGDEIDLTHKHIARMLGVRRASVTDGLHQLEGAGLIHNRRGHIVIRDRQRLRDLAGCGYGFAETHYSRAIAPFGK